MTRVKLYNTLSHKIENFEPVEDKKVQMYSCGPTVYDHIHIGNLAAFVAADTLRRSLQSAGYKIKHVMNFTDVDDKTIRRSREHYPDLAPEEALRKLTEEYGMIFLENMQAIGNDIRALKFVKATENIEAMRQLIRQLYAAGFAYIADDGIYFSIEKYIASGKTYGQLLTLDSKNTSNARINNDEYDKESIHDFALWKTRKDGEPAWEFELNGHNVLGRPGWHIECSAMSANNLGQPFDIHTGGVDLIFPHHENEIAQSTAGEANPLYAKYFVHNEHLLVDGRKMSKSLDNFFTLRDIQEKGYDPLAFRLLVLQSHYRSQSNFSWENLEAAQNRLHNLRSMAVLRWQPTQENQVNTKPALEKYKNTIQDAMNNDLNTPTALAALQSLVEAVGNTGISSSDQKVLIGLLEWLDALFGLQLANTADITSAQKQILAQRAQARADQDWGKSDKLRDELSQQGIGLRDTDNGQIWYPL